MSIRAEITADLAEAFDDDLADAVRSFTYTQYDRNNQTFDPVTRTNTPDSCTFTGRGVFDGTIESEIIDSNVEPVEAILITLQSEWEGDDRPRPGDMIEVDGEGFFRVGPSSKDPSNSIYEIKLHKGQ
ncbi:hypothetical protein [Zhongshania sp.]|uniref:hypothetical protein n=1 Tax=Zhongshania sp. TaxID=1971902 RepID=UPI0035653767